MTEKSIRIASLWVFILLSVRLIGQDSLNVKKEKVYHNYFLNVVPDHYDKFLVGTINISRGSQKAEFISLFNWNKRKFNGLQLGLFNFNLGIFKGAQVALINNCYDTLKGTQIGLINIAKVNKGVQTGIINYSDSSANGFSFGIISFLRRADYQGVELYVSELFPINLTYKLGLSDRYSSLSFSANEDFSSAFLGFGTGFYLLEEGKSTLNIDYKFQYSLNNSTQKILNIATKMRYRLTDRMFISGGPAFAWSFIKSGGHFNTPLAPVYTGFSKNGKHRITLGYRAAISFTIKDVKAKKYP